MSARKSRRTVLILSQVYVPDPASVGQYMADAAIEMVGRGYRVVVLTADRGYDDPATKYASRETLDGVEVIRLPWSSFGKRSIAIRLIGGLLFVFQSVLRSLFIRNVDVVLVSTSPPMASLGALIISVLHVAPVNFWVMDLNPDQVIALKKIRPNSPAVRCFNWLNRRILARARDVIVLDRFMAARVNAKLPVEGKMSVIPPWAQENYLSEVDHAANPFRREHKLEGKLVVMYSGNHGPSNPLSTILQAALCLTDDPRFVFMFVGGGVGKREVESIGASNVRSLPYQPLSELKYSLSAADIHVVTMGNDMVGIIHPCKVYGAMAVARPILFIGPNECHVTDIIEDRDIGWHVQHGDVEGVVRLLRTLVAIERSNLSSRGARARQVVHGVYGKDVLCARFCDILERSPDRVESRGDRVHALTV